MGGSPTERLPRSQYSSMSQDSRTLDLADVEASESLSLPPVPLGPATCSVGSLCTTYAKVQIETTISSRSHILLQSGLAMRRQ